MKPSYHIIFFICRIAFPRKNSMHKYVFLTAGLLLLDAF
jgi:hypothetical protein